MTNLQYGLYNKDDVAPGYFGANQPSKIDDRLAKLGLLDEEPAKESGLLSDIKSKGFIESAKEGFTDFGKEFVSGARILGEDIRKIETGRLEETTGLLGDFLKAGQGNIDRIQTFNEVVDKTGGSMFDKIIGAGLSTVGAGVDFGGDVVVSGLKTLAPEGLERATAETLQEFANTEFGTSLIGLVKTGGEKYNEFKSTSDEANRLGQTLELLLPAGEIITGGAGAKVLKEAGGEIIEAGVKQIPKIQEGLEIAKEGVKTGFEAIKQTPSKVIGELPSSLSQKIAGIDDQAAKILSETSTEDFDRFLQSAKDAKADIKAPTPLAIAGDRASEALDLISKSKSTAGANKSKILKAVETKTLETQPILDGFKNFLDERFNLELDGDLNITAIKGKVATISDTSIKDLQSLSDELLDLFTKDNIDLGNLDATVDRLQDALNFNKLNRGAGGTATKTEKQISSFIEGTINKRLKEVAGDDFIDANAEFRRLLDLETRLGKSLGDKGVRGEGLMKAVFSPVTGEKTKRIFREIEEEFGIDLINEAGLAKFSMQSVGDVRQANLLEALDLGPGFSGIQSSKMAQILDFLGKKAFSPERVGRGLTK